MDSELKKRKLSNGFIEIYFFSGVPREEFLVRSPRFVVGVHRIRLFLDEHVPALRQSQDVVAVDVEGLPARVLQLPAGDVSLLLIVLCKVNIPAGLVVGRVGERVGRIEQGVADVVRSENALVEGRVLLESRPKGGLEHIAVGSGLLGVAEGLEGVEVLHLDLLLVGERLGGPVAGLNDAVGWIREVVHLILQVVLAVETQLLGSVQVILRQFLQCAGVVKSTIELSFA